MEMSIYKREVNQLCSMIDHHPHRLVDPSPWPLLGSMGALTSTIGSVMYMHYFTGGGTILSERHARADNNHTQAPHISSSINY